MSIASFCVRKPVTTSMFYLGVLVLGLISWVLVPQELFPTITFPQLVVITRYGNAAPEEIENLVTKVLEESVGTVPNLKRIRSLSKEGVSLVTLEFDWGTDMGFAHLSTREKIDQIKDRMPSEAEEPIINRINPFAQPMMIFSVSGEMPMAVLTDVTKKAIKQRLEKVGGVASANISGGQEREIVVEVDRGRMEASNISLASVVDALKTTNLNYPAGTTQGKFYEYVVRTMGEFKNLDEIGKTVIKVEKPPEFDFPTRGLEATRSSQVRGERMLHLEAISVVKDTFKEQTSFSRHNGKENISLAIQKQADANVLNTAKRVRAAVEELKLALPKGMDLELVYDESEFIQGSINGLVMDSLLGGLLAFGVLFAFLRSFGSAFIAALVIPVAALITFVCMFFCHISINMLSLAGISLAIGSLVDTAIVCMENVTRHKVELKKDDVTAAMDGADEVLSAVVCGTITNIAAFLPLVFSKGVAQKLFGDMFFSNTAATVGSLVAAITLIPQLVSHPLPFEPLLRIVSKFMNKEGAEGEAESPLKARLKKIGRVIAGGIPDEVSDRIIAVYRKWLVWMIEHPLKTTAYLIGAFLVSIVLMGMQDRVFMPEFDQGQFILKIQMPVGTRLDVTDRVMQKIEKDFVKVKAIKDVTVAIGSSNSESVDALGSHQGQAVIALDRDIATTEDVIAELKKLLDAENLEGAEVQYILQGSVLASAFETSSPIVIEVKGPDLVTLKKLAEDIMGDIGKVPGIYGVKTSLALPSSETRVEIDKVRASGYQLSVADIARIALIGIKGYVATTFKEGGEEVDVRVQLREEDRGDIDAIRRLTVRAPSGIMVPLSEIASLTSARGPSEIKHLDQQRAIVISANILKRGTSEVVKDVSEKLTAYQNLSDYNILLSGESQQIKESFGGLAVASILAVLLNYMIMAAEFEDLVQPMIVMLTVPLGIIGVALSLFVTHTALSAPVILGYVMLAGMIVSNGIVLIDFTNVLLAEGNTLFDACVKSGTARFRPIVMSNLTSVLGVLPLALGLSEGSELTSPMAVVSVGGLAVSAALTLFVIPVMTFYWERWRSKGKYVIGWGEEPAAAPAAEETIEAQYAPPSEDPQA